MKLLLLLLSVTLAALPSVTSADEMETVAREAFIVDAETGAVLFSKNADTKMPTSSMSKTMTMYMVFEAIKNGRLTLEQQIPISEKAWRMQGSRMFLDINTTVKVEDLSRGVIIQSGNDAAVALAEGMAGTEAAFADAMNRKAKELGMNSSNFMNASGWPDPNHYSTARDLTTLGIAMIENFPDLYKYYSELDFTYNGIKQGNRNPLLYKNIGADGIKTGHTEAAGYGLMASAVRDGRRVVMTLNGMANMNERAQESTRLMEWALASFKNVELFKDGETITESKVAMGMMPSVPLVAEGTKKITLPRMADSQIKREAIYTGPLEAPVTKGQKVGVVRVTVPSMDPIETPLVAANDVPRLGFFPSLLEKAKRLVVGDRSPLSREM
jgi:D-alanyl-D-alanine carboxypeptidase (penicillin-binding protein 5/6)